MMCSILRHNRKVRLSGLALACYALAGITVAQEPSDHAPAIKVQVQQVLVPVVVTDRKGHFITDLKASDFQVFEDGVEQKLTVLNTQQNAAPELLQPDATPAQRAGEPVALPPTTSESRPRHTYLIVLDTLNSSLAGFNQAREALKKLFKEEQGSETQYAVIALGRTTLVVQNLTHDPKVVLAALAKKELSHAIVSNQASNLTQQEIELRQMLEQNPPTPLEVVLNWANQIARERDRLTRNFLMDLRSLTEQLSRMPGRRVMIMVSDGFNLEPGREFFDMIATFTRTPNYAFYNKTSNLSDEVRAIARVATAQNVTFYTLDSRGLYAPPGPDISEKLTTSRIRIMTPDLLANMTSTIDTSAIEKQDPMNYLAQATGGVFYQNSNDLLKGLRQSFADGRSYYELAYYSSNPAIDGKYRAIKVEVKGKNLIIRAKPGYWASPTDIATAAATTHPQPSVLATTAPRGNNPTATPITHAEPSTLAAPVATGSIPTTIPTTRTEPPPVAAPTPSLIDIPTAKLVRKVPELKNLKPTASQDLLTSILQKVGASVATLFNNFPSVTSREQVVEQRLEVAQSAQVQTYNDKIYHDFRYLALANSDRKQINLKEYRTDANGRGIDLSGLDNGYKITQGFVSTPVFFDPAYQPDSRFRFLGQQVIENRATYVVAFAQLPSAQVKERIALGNGKSVVVLTQGLAWIDPSNYQIVRMWTGLMAPVPEIKLEAQTTRVNFGEVHFQAMASGLWLPNKVEVEMKFSAVIFRNSHTYSDFKLFSVQTQDRQDAPASPK